MRQTFEKILSPILENSSVVAGRLADKFGDIYTLASATDNDICEAVDGEMSIVLYIRLAFSLAKRRITDAFLFGKRHTEKEISQYLKAQFVGLVDETLLVLSTDTDGRIIALDYAGEGTVSLSAVLPRKILDLATKRGASGVILAHNHPRGYAEPSDDDVKSTHTLSEVLSSAGITLINHYVVAGDKCSVIKLN